MKQYKAIYLLWPILSAVASTPLLSQAGVFEGFPDVVICRIDQTASGRSGDILFFVSARDDAGYVRYKSLERTAVNLVIDENGTVAAANLKHCDGKTLEQLRADGRVVEAIAP